MALKFYDSPFHVNHDDETASKMVMKMDLSIMLKNIIKSKEWTQEEAAEKSKTSGKAGGLKYEPLKAG